MALGGSVQLSSTIVAFAWSLLLGSGLLPDVLRLGSSDITSRFVLPHRRLGSLGNWYALATRATDFPGCFHDHCAGNSRTDLPRRTVSW